MGLHWQVTPQAMANNAHTSPTTASLLLTRAQEDAERFVAELDPALLAAVDICIAPLLRIEAAGSATDLPDTDDVIFTSAKAVEIAPQGQGRVAYCVGAMTAGAATANGWQVKLIAETAEDLLSAIETTKPLTHLSGRHQRGDIAERLTNRGVSCRRQVIYDQHLQPLSDAAQQMLEGDKPVIVPLFSPRIAGHFAQQARSLRQVHVMAISPAAAQALGDRTLTAVHVAMAPTGFEMRRGVENLLQRASLP